MMNVLGMIISPISGQRAQGDRVQRKSIQVFSIRVENPGSRFRRDGYSPDSRGDCRSCRRFKRLWKGRSESTAVFLFSTRRYVLSVTIYSIRTLLITSPRVTRCRCDPRGRNGVYRRGGLLRREQIRSLPEGNDEHRVPHTEKGYSVVYRQFQGKSLG